MKARGAVAERLSGLHISRSVVISLTTYTVAVSNYNVQYAWNLMKLYVISFVISEKSSLSS